MNIALTSWKALGKMTWGWLTWKSPCGNKGNGRWGMMFRWFICFCFLKQDSSQCLWRKQQGSDLKKSASIFSGFGSNTRWQCPFGFPPSVGGPRSTPSGSFAIRSSHTAGSPNWGRRGPGPRAFRSRSFSRPMKHGWKTKPFLAHIFPPYQYQVEKYMCF